MKRYRKFECWLADVDQCLDCPAETADESLLGILAYSFTHFSDQLPHNIDQLQNLVAVLKKLREVRGAGRAVFEKRVMQSLADCALSVCSQLHESGCSRTPLSTPPDLIPPEQRSLFIFLQELCRYAIDCLAFSRSRDSLAGQRRSCALEILANAIDVIEPPEEVLDAVRRILKAGRGNSLVGALLFCEAYYASRQDGVPEELEKILFALVSKTDSRGLAVGALNVLVESGNISEFTALDHIDDWKERHYR